MKRLILGLIVFAFAHQAQAQRTIELNVFREDAATLVGRLKGFFAHQSLDVHTSFTPNSTDQMRGLISGKYQIASTAFDNVLGWSGRDGAELVAVSQVVDTAVFPVFVRPEIKQWADLRGRKLAVDAVDTAFALVLRRVLLDQGLDFKRGDYQLVPVGNTPLRLDSMKKGDTFAGVLTPPYDTQAASAGMVRLGDSRASLPEFPNTLLAVNRAWAAKERGELVSFLRAWLAAQKWMRANREESLKLVGAELKVDPKTAGRLLDEVSATGALNRRAMEAALKLRNDFALTPPLGPNVSRYYDERYYGEAVR